MTTDTTHTNADTKTEKPKKTQTKKKWVHEFQKLPKNIRSDLLLIGDRNNKNLHEIYKQYIKIFKVIKAETNKKRHKLALIELHKIYAKKHWQQDKIDDEKPIFKLGDDLSLEIEYERDSRHSRDIWRYILSDSGTVIMDETSHYIPSQGSQTIFSKIKKIIKDKYQITEEKVEKEYVVKLKQNLRAYNWIIFYKKDKKDENEMETADIYATDSFKQAKLLNTKDSIIKGWEYLSRDDFDDLLYNELKLDYIIDSKSTAINEFLNILKTIILTNPSGTVLSGGSSTGKSKTVDNSIKKGMASMFFAKASNLTQKAPYYLRDAFGSARTLLIFDSDLDDNDPLMKLSRQVSVDDEGCSYLVTTPADDGISKVTRITLSRNIKSILSTSTKINYEQQFSTRVGRLGVESSPNKIFKIGKMKLDKKESLPWNLKVTKSFRPDNDENWLIKSTWIPLVYNTSYQCPGISKLAEYQPITHARATRDIDKFLGDLDGWFMLHMPKLTWVNHDDEIVAIVPPNIWLEGIFHCNKGILDTYLERDARDKHVIDVLNEYNVFKKSGFTVKDVIKKTKLHKKDIYKILSNLEDESIVATIEEARGSRPAKYMFYPVKKREGYFDFSKKIDVEKLNDPEISNKSKYIKNTNQLDEIKRVWDESWKEYEAVLKKNKNEIIRELTIPLFSLKLKQFGVLLEKSGECGENGETAKDTINGGDTTNKNNNNQYKDDQQIADDFVGICVSVSRATPHSPLSPPFDIFVKKFNISNQPQQKKKQKKSDDDKKSKKQQDADDELLKTMDV